MALDGITISNIIFELAEKITGGKIDKIYQPEQDEIIIAVRKAGTLYKILLTANPSNPRFHFTQLNKSNPSTAPLFCMVMRKHLSGGKIIKIFQPDFERIAIIQVESMNEMGDYSIKNLIIEIMGKHSNIILTDENNVILDSIKHITHDKSSIREVLPNKSYVAPPSKDKINTLKINENNFNEAVIKKSAMAIQNIIYQSYNGISPVMASEICFRAKVNPSDVGEQLTCSDINNIYQSFKTIVNIIAKNDFKPEIIYDKKSKLLDFSPIEMKQFGDLKKEAYSSISELLEYYYYKKDLTYRLNQKTQDLRKIINQNIERCIKKEDIQRKTLREISGREKLKLYGELITANIYSLKTGMNSFTTVNFYDENSNEITIPLEPELTPAENAQKYFKQYNKEKRTFAALQVQIKQNKEELEYLDGLLESIKNCTNEQEIKEIRQELYEQGIIKKFKNLKEKNTVKKSKPMHFISSDNIDIYVGKNNRQNDELTLKTAHSNDIWLHTKEIPGSHVIIVSNGGEVPIKTLNEAAMLAAYYSKGKNSSMVPVDYTIKKNVKKPAGAKPGMVIYEYYKTAYINPDEKEVMKIKKID